MTRLTNGTHTHRQRGGGILLILSLILALLGMTGAATSTAAVAPGAAPAKFQAAEQAVGLTFKGGPTHPGPVWAGTWKNGPLGFCIDFDLPAPNSSGTKKVTAVLPGLDAEKSAQIKHITNAYVATKSPERAAHAQLAIWTLQGEPSFKAWYRTDALTAAVRKGVDAILGDAAQRAPYKLSLKAGKVHVGQQGTGTVKVLRKDGRPAVGRSVVLSATGAKIVSVRKVAGHQGTTTADGLAFAYQRSKPGKVGLKAVVTAPSTTTAGLSTTEVGHQRTLSGGYVESSIANYEYDLTPGRPTIRSSCDSDCAGVSTLAFKICNPAGAQPVSWTEKVGDKVVATLAAAGGQCVTKTARLADGKDLTAAYCYTKALGGACTTAKVAMAGKYEVICPPWTKVVYELGCDCEAADGGTVTFTAPGDSRRFYRGFVSLLRNGTTTVRPFDLVNGKPMRTEVGAIPGGATVVISFGVYRDKERLVQIGVTHVLRRLTLDPA